MGAVAVGRVLGLATAAEGKGLASDGIDLVRRGLPAHELIIQQLLENQSANCGRWNAGGGSWKAGGRFLEVLLIPIEKNAGGSIEGQLVGLLKAAPAIFVCFLIESDICL